MNGHGHLPVRQVQDRFDPGITGQRLARVRDDADDGQRRRHAGDAKLLPQRVLAREVATNERLADDGDGRRAGPSRSSMPRP